MGQFSHELALKTNSPGPHAPQESRAADENFPLTQFWHPSEAVTFDTFPGAHRGHSHFGKGGMVRFEDVPMAHSSH